MNFNTDQQVKDLNKQLNTVVEMQNKFYSSLDPKVYEKVKEHHEDINKIMSEFKKGNTKALNELLNKYNSK